MRLAEAEFRRLTMGELAALEEAWREERNHEDWRIAYVIATLANLHRAQDSPVLKPADVMPWLAPKESAPRLQTSEDMLSIFEECVAAMGGIVHPNHRPLAR